MGTAVVCISVRTTCTRCSLPLLLNLAQRILLITGKEERGHVKERHIQRLVEESFCLGGDDALQVLDAPLAYGIHHPIELVWVDADPVVQGESFA